MNMGQLGTRLRQSYLDHIVTGPNPLYRASFGRDLPAQEVLSSVGDLKSSGVTNIDDFVNADLASRLRSQMDAAINGTHRSTGATANEISNYNIIEKPLRLSPEMLHLASQPKVLAIAERYFRNQVYLADIDARVIPPTRIEDVEAALLKKGQMKTGSSSHWHRDARGRQLKLMAYLSDVDDEDTRFVFLPYSHKNVPLHPSFEETRFTDAQVAAMPMRPVEWLGAAGTAKLFDTNLVHRLKRKATGKVRYSITFYYTPGQHLRQLSLNADEFDALSVEQRKIFGDLDGGSRLNFG